MSTNLHAHPHYAESGRLLSIILEVPENHMESFKTILNRALNTWPDAPPEWKDLADRLEFGVPLQDYYSGSSNAKL